MAIDKDLFSSDNFQYTIRRYCNQIGWQISEINASKAIMQFNMASGTTQTLFILRYDTTLEFSCPSGLKFDTFDNIPHALSSYLLVENSKFKVGFWCIEQLGGRQVFSIMHNAKIDLMDVTYFMSVVNTLVTKCDEFEQAAEQALGGR